MARRRKPAVNVNEADAEDLTRIEGIDGERARLIIEYRQANGRFESWEELTAVPGIGAVLLEKVQASATLGEPREEEVGVAAQDAEQAEPEETGVDAPEEQPDETTAVNEEELR